MTGTSLRSGVHVGYAPLIDALVRQAERISELSVLRVHWYDSAKDGVPDLQQQRIGELPKAKLRLGRFGMDGQQSRHLIRAADGIEILSPETVDQTVAKVEMPPPSVSQLVAVVPPAGKPQVRPTPRDLAELGSSPAVRPSPVIVYSATTGREPQVTPGYEDPVELAEQIDSVVMNVLTAFRKSATAEALAELEDGKPSIPRLRQGVADRFI
ncbi:hypothetical protein ACLQ2S_24795 [Micromonospora sp. DT48]|uniref:hypothetical protein n=1 Tax=Micromonospora sp. DT48 TaxID=3393429 RepID=UPI003CEA5F5C